MAIKIAGKADASLRAATGMTKKELATMQQAVVKANMAMRSQFSAGFADMDKGFAAVERTAKKVFDTVAIAAKAAAIATGAVVAASTKVGMDFEKQMSTVQAISTASTQDMQLLSDKAKEMGINTVFSATEAGKAMEYMAMAGWKTQDMLSGVEGIMNLAAASGEELGSVSDIVTDALTAFKLSAEDSTHFADVLAAASSNANTNVGMMGETFKYVAPVAGALGYSIEDTATAIGLMANSGIKASQAGTALRKIMNRTSQGIEISSKAIGDITIATADADGNMRSFKSIIDDMRVAFAGMSEQEAAWNAEQIAGTTAMSGLLAIVQASDADYQKLYNSIENANGAAERMADTRLNNLAGDITLAGSALEGAGIKIYEDLKPVMREATQGFTEIVQQTTQWFKSSGVIKDISNAIVTGLPTARRVLLETGEAVLNFAKPLLDLGAWCLANPTAISSVLIGIGSAMMTYKVASTGFKFAQSIMSIGAAFTNPVTGVVVGATLAVGAIAALTHAYKASQAEIGKRSLDKHFGNLSLSLKEVDEVARHIVDNGTFDALDTAVAAFDETKNFINEFNSSATKLDKLNWKVSIGIDLNNRDKQEYLDSVSSFIANAQDALISEHNAMNLGIDFLISDESSKSEIKSQFDNFYNNNYNELTEAGQRLNQAVNDAFSDGILEVHEAEEIAKFQRQMAEIQDKLAASEYSAKLDMATNLSELTPDSLLDVMKQTDNFIAERDEQAREVVTNLIASLHSQLEEGTITQKQLEEQSNAIYESYREKMALTRAERNEYINNAILENYSSEVGDYYQQMQEAVASYRGDLGEVVQGMFLYDNETTQAMSAFWESMQDDFYKELESTKKNYMEMGKEIPAEIAKGLSDSATIGAMAGDKMAMWYLIQQEVSKGASDPELAADLKEVANGYMGTAFDAISVAAKANQSVSREVRTAMQAIIDKAFSTPFNVTAMLNLKTATNSVDNSAVRNVLSTQGRADAINKEFNKLNNKGLPGFATGGIIQNPTLATFAEDGPEAAIPIDGSQRSIDLWKKTGELLGVFDGRSRAETSLSKLEDSSGSEGSSINFAPVLNFNGGTPSKDDIVEANRMSLREFEEMYKQLVKKNSRLGFAN
jgi:phage tail tape measure protein, TP901 family|nr:MAG TPA: minor tail protein [Caudoviricetes sp.]